MNKLTFIFVLLFCISECTLDTPVNIATWLTGPVYSVSAGETHVTVASYQSAASTNINIHIHDTVNNITSYLGGIGLGGYTGIF